MNAIKTLFAVLSLSALSFAGTLTGQVTLPNTSLPLRSGTFTFTLSQSAYVPGSFLVVPGSVNCYTDSQQGNVVGLPDPLIAPVVTPDTISGSLPAGTYYVVYVYRDAANNKTYVSPETAAVLSGSGKLTINPPALQPANTTWDIFVGSSSGTETAQGTAQPFSNFVLSVPLITGASMPSSNNTACSLRFTDELIPSGTWYNTNLVSANGSQIPGFPQRWQMYGGAASTINLSNGFPLFQNVTVFPTPIYANPPSGTQSISGTLNLPGTVNITGTINNPKIGGTIQSPSGAQMGITLKKGSATGNYSTASTSYVDIDAANLSYTVTIPTGWKLAVAFSGGFFTNPGTGFLTFAIFDGSVIQEGSYTSTAVTVPINCSVATVIAGDGNSHTIKMQWKISANTANLQNTGTTVPTMTFILMPSN